MEPFCGQYKKSKTTAFLKQLNKFVFIFGLPNYWIENLDFSNKFCRIYSHFNLIENKCIFFMILSEIGAYFTQKTLTDEQISNLTLYTSGQIAITFFRIRLCQQVPAIRDVMYKLGIGLKDVHNDLEVEKQMIKKAKFSSTILVINCGSAFFLILLKAFLETIYTGEPFNSIITVIPDLNDKSTISNIIRAVYNIFWCIHMTRIFSVYTLIICLITALSHQFKNLSSYFASLERIFNKDNHLMHKEKEEMYENSLLIGINLHAETLKCAQQIQTICREVFSGQIIFNLILLLVPMYQLVTTERTVANTVSIILTAGTILLSTGFFMWNAGDVTVEASIIPTSIFCSGWENCQNDRSKRIRKLVVISMMRAQTPVVLTGFGIILMSYQSYVSIVKSSYSVFSVLY